jgi:histidyl-tRNA synthetase
MSKLQPVRGTHDILPDEFEKFQAVVTRAREFATLYGFQEMATPIFEATEVFARSMGETSDVVSKEMFTFQTKGEESVTLRPEFTAGIVRAFISNGMQQHLPLKLFSTGPAFRYERPQKGRQRQFHQVNFEWLGDGSSEVDVEIIGLAGHLLQLLQGKGCTLLLNTLGDEESRDKYRHALVSYLTPLANKLSEDSKRRLEKNPLRILDSKDAADKEIIVNAPKMTDYLSAASKERFEAVCNGLKDVTFFQDIKIDPSLVRGLDYYTDTVFEFVASTGELGAQNTVLAGGRYDGLVEQMGGKSTPAIGFAAGVERLSLLEQKIYANALNLPDVKIIIMPMEGIPPVLVHEQAGYLRNRIMLTAIERRLIGIGRQYSVEILWSGKLGKRLEKASKMNATHVLILGDEMKSGNMVLKNMKTGEQMLISCGLDGLKGLVESLIK